MCEQTVQLSESSKVIDDCRCGQESHRLEYDIGWRFRDTEHALKQFFACVGRPRTIFALAGRAMPFWPLLVYR